MPSFPVPSQFRSFLGPFKYERTVCLSNKRIAFRVVKMEVGATGWFSKDIYTPLPGAARPRRPPVILKTSFSSTILILELSIESVSVWKCTPTRGITDLTAGGCGSMKKSTGSSRSRCPKTSISEDDPRTVTWDRVRKT